ncbi:MAG: hypothetical protein HY301_19785 [Verrucomicrobia bacterium]|nr:hypothetical protein [Verrucomicrobiota bacterium]
MSLKAIHIVFISAAMLMCVVFGLWALGEWRAADGTANLLYLIGSGVGFLALAVYGWFFLKKLKNVSYL